MAVYRAPNYPEGALGREFFLSPWADLVPPRRKPQAKSAGKPKFRWLVLLPDGAGGFDELRESVLANTASEARAIAKRHVGGRLPVGAMVRKYVPEEK